MRIQIRLANLPQSTTPVLTAYLQTAPSDASSHLPVAECVTWLKKEARVKEESLAESDRKNFSEQLNRVVDFVSNREAHEKTLVIVAGPSKWTTISLQEHLPQAIHWGKPETAPLYWLTLARKHYAVACVDHKQARIFEYASGNLLDVAEEKFTLDSSQWKRKEFGHAPGKEGSTKRGVQRDEYQKRIDNKFAAFCRKIGKKAAELCVSQNLTALVIAAPSRFLHASQSGVPGGFKLPVVPVDIDLAGMDHAHILQALAPKISGWQAAHDEKLVAAAFADDHGKTTGIDETLSALQRGKLRAVLVAAGTHADVRICAECGWVDRVAGPSCSVCGGHRRFAEFESLFPELASKHAVEVNVVTDKAADHLSRDAEGVIGFLRTAKASARKKARARVASQFRGRRATKR